MTREEQRKYKKTAEYLEAKAKEEFKKYNLKKKDYIFYTAENCMFYSVMLSAVNDKIHIYFYSKPFWLDDILWDILDMNSNKKAPVSLRGIGAFTVQSNIQKNEYTVKGTEEIDLIVNKAFEKLMELANTYNEEKFLTDCKNIAYQQDVINIIVLIHNKEYKKALEILKNSKITDFSSNNKYFSELAIDYIQNKQITK